MKETVISRILVLLSLVITTSLSQSSSTQSNSNTGTASKSSSSGTATASKPSGSSPKVESSWHKMKIWIEFAKMKEFSEVQSNSDVYKLLTKNLMSSAIEHFSQTYQIYGPKKHTLKEIKCGTI